MSGIVGTLNHLIGIAGIVGPGIAVKAMGKAVPKIAAFTTGAINSGYTVDQILDFIKEKVTPSGERRQKNELTERVGQGIARPDEKAALTQIEQNQAPMNAGFDVARVLGRGIAGGAAERYATGIQEQQKLLEAQNLKKQQKKEKEESKFKKSAEKRAQEKHEYEMNKGVVQSAGKKDLLKRI